KKTAMSKDWNAVLEKGWDGLKLNPWDVWTLSTMADAAGALHLDEAQLTYLKQALDVDPKDGEVNRKCGRALAALGHFDQAITCWHRVEQAKPGDEEAARAIGDLAIERTISKGGYEEAESSTDVRADKAQLAGKEADSKYTPQQRLERSIEKNPSELGSYFELADLHTRDERYKQAEEILGKALEASGGDVAVRERLEDAQLRTARAQLQIAKNKAAKDKTPEAVTLYKKMKKELNAAELDYYRNRGERYPNNLRFKYELALRLKNAGEFQEAIKSFQAASGDPKTKAQVHLGLGECFQAIKQYKLSMQNYEAALDALTTREVDERKWALYLAGYLALALGEKQFATGDAEGKTLLDRAERHLNELASLEFGYKDVPKLLDRITKIRDKG
ncbi:MAG TPA: tetratricopeptide repeat protein, partial [Pirellulales bacterium]|nr:tetratricopeptide repeat protein [Pirellulales bacterium]